jgi:hypothetical protein
MFAPCSYRVHYASILNDAHPTAAYLQQLGEAWTIKSRANAGKLLADFFISPEKCDNVTVLPARDCHF